MKLLRLSLVVSTLLAINAVQANVWNDVKNYFQRTAELAKAHADVQFLKKIIQTNLTLFDKQQPSESDVANFVSSYRATDTLLKGLTGLKVPAEVATIIPTVLSYVTFLKPLYNQLVNNPNAAQKVVQFINWVRENSGELKTQVDQLKNVFALQK